MENKTKDELIRKAASGKKLLIIGIVLFASAMIIAVIMGAIWGLMLVQSPFYDGNLSELIDSLVRSVSSPVSIVLMFAANALEAGGTALIIVGIITMVKAKKQINKLNSSSPEL